MDGTLHRQAKALKAPGDGLLTFCAKLDAAGIPYELSTRTIPVRDKGGRSTFKRTDVLVEDSSVATFTEEA